MAKTLTIFTNAHIVDILKVIRIFRLHTAFINKDAQTLQEELTDILYETISSFDENENYYHGLVAGLLSGMKGYRTKTNRETEKGRCDLFVKPISSRKEAFIVEFKTTKKVKELEKRRKRQTAVSCFGRRDRQ